MELTELLNEKSAGGTDVILTKNLDYDLCLTYGTRILFEGKDTKEGSRECIALFRAALEDNVPDEAPTKKPKKSRKSK